ncbi:glycoside hydrolase family 57 protein [Patescibacteria group bacterium]|nr:glycoside hydrolase family 57 protein [Patescibacteria group bacterium]
MQTHTKNVCFYFQVHQPYRLSETSFFEEEKSGDLFLGPKNSTNRFVFEKVAQKCYIPATKMLLDLLRKHPEFRVAFSLSGVFLDQCEEYGSLGGEVLNLFKEIAKTKQAEFLCETYHHSLAFLFSKEEYGAQIQLQAKKIKKLFGAKPKIFRNTELIYNNDLAEFIRKMGFEGMLAEGWDSYLNGRSPNYLYQSKKIEIHKEDARIAKKYKIAARAKKELPLLLKNYKLSDDVAFRFSNKSWEEHPLTTEKYARWIENTEGETINLFMDYETLGEHQWEDTGIFEFFKHLPKALLEKGIGFCTPSETIANLKLRDEYDIPQYLSWADTDRDISAWLDNEIQRSALHELSELEKMIHPHKKKKGKVIKNLLNDFRRLQTSDHFYYMSTKYFNDGDVHKYFSPYDSEHSPYEAYIHYMNTLRGMHQRVDSLNSPKGNIKR